MKTVLITTLTLLLTAAGPAAGAEETATPAPAENPEMAPPAPSPAPPPTVAPAPIAPTAATPQPAIGWRNSKRAPIYAQTMLLGGGFVEDDRRRLTTQHRPTLGGIGFLGRAGAVLDEHQRVGVRLQSFVRPTKKIIREPSATRAAGDNDWGSVQFGYLGPEYLYTTDVGAYLAGSVGVAGAMSQSNTDCDTDRCYGDRHHDSHIERASAGGAMMASLGYEWRLHKWFAINAEAFGGVYRGIDTDNERAINNAVFGFGVGAGF